MSFHQKVLQNPKTCDPLSLVICTFLWRCACDMLIRSMAMEGSWQAGLWEYAEVTPPTSGDIPSWDELDLAMDRQQCSTESMF